MKYTKEAGTVKPNNYTHNENPTSIRLSKDIKAKLDQMSEEYQIPKSSLIKMAICKFYKDCNFNVEVENEF